MSLSIEDGVASAIQIGIDVPAELQSTVLRHQASLSALIESLRSSGIDDTTVDLSVRSLVESYRTELTAAIGKILEYQ